MKHNSDYIYGRNSVISAIESKKSIAKIFLLFGTSGEPVSKIIDLSRKYNIPLSKADKPKFRTLCQKAKVNFDQAQGVIALVEQVETISLEELLKNEKTESSVNIIVALDQISDPHNLGAIARSAEAAGALGLLITSTNSSPITASAIKASAGALNSLDVVKSDNLASDLNKLKEAGYWVVGTDLETDQLYSNNIYEDKMVVVIGSEGDGMQKDVKSVCDFIVKIPMIGNIESLNASVSSGIILFEILRQRTERD